NHVIGRGEATDGRQQRGGAGAALLTRQRFATSNHATEGVGLAVLGDVLLSGADDPHRVGFTLFRGVAPGGDAAATENATDRLGVGFLHGGDVEPELEAGATPRNPQHLVAVDLA